MLKRLIVCAGAALLQIGASSLPAFSKTEFSSQRTPLWLRDVKISPDGKRIAFCYKGDIFTVPSQGGSATRLTTLPSYEQTPIWSPDSKSIAFASDRYGSADVFVMNADGGPATRLTFNSAAETPLCFTPDGKDVLFSAYIQAPATSAQFPRQSFTQVYRVAASGGRTTQYMGTTAHAICFSPDGSFFLYQDSKGIENTWRKHHISSVTRDVWHVDTASGIHTNITARPGEDLDPVLSQDGRTVYLLSEPSDGDARPRPQGWQTSINVYSFDLHDPGKMRQESSFTTHPVRFLSIAGNLLCYTWNGEIYTQKVGGEPAKVHISLTLDEENAPVLKTLSSGASEAAVSPDGSQVAFVLHGEVFVTSVDYKTTKRITTTPAEESGVCFCKDGRSLVYASERSGVRQLYKASIVRKEDPNFPNATLVKETLLFDKPHTDMRSPVVSPDGRKIAFIQDRSRLAVAPIGGGPVKLLTDGSGWIHLGSEFAFSWSPDSKWITFEYVSNGHDPYTNIGLVNADGGPVTDITGSGYTSGNPRFSPDGTGILFQSDRYGMRSHASWGSQDDVFLCLLSREAFDKYRLDKENLELLKGASKAAGEKKDSTAKSRGVEVELEGISDRIVRLTPASSSISDAILSKDGETLYYTARFEDDFDLWKMDVRNGNTKLLCKKAGRGALASDRSGGKIFLLGSKGFRKLDGSNLKSISYSARLRIDPAAEREYMFGFVEREERERFYCTDMHGVDWKSYCDSYRRFLPHIGNNYDFSEMLSELLGELNVSHTGSGYRPSLPGEKTGSLGLLYDMNYRGEGMKVAEVVAGGPFDKASLSLKKGDVIVSINGCSIGVENEISVLLSGCAGVKTLVGVKGKGEMVVVPVSQARQNELLYKRWVKRCADKVTALSGGRLGYVHIRSMNDGSFRTIYSDILGKYNKCEGIVIDQRFNGGGRLHEDIEVLFGARKYLTQEVRGIFGCDMPSRRWTKPSIMLQCECDYSNAHGTPWTYRHCGLGKLVGAPVPGTMTSVNWVDLLDDSMYFGIPVSGYRTAEGHFLENTQLEPDVEVYNSPMDLDAGRDAQLEAAVKELLLELDGAAASGR